MLPNKCFIFFFTFIIVQLQLSPFYNLNTLYFTSVLPPFKDRQVHGICTDGKIFMEPLGCLACLYSCVGKPCTLQVVCLSACLMSWPLLPSVAPIMAPVLLHVSHHHHPQQGVPTCLSNKRATKTENCQNIT